MILQHTRQHIFTNDVLMHCVLYLQHNDTVSLCCIDKQASLLIHDKSLWKNKMNTYSNYLYIGGQYNYDVKTHKKLDCALFSLNTRFKENYYYNTFKFRSNDDLSCIVRNYTFRDNYNYQKIDIMTCNGNVNGKFKVQILSSTGDNNYILTGGSPSIDKIKQYVFHIFFHFPGVICIAY